MNKLYAYSTSIVVSVLLNIFTAFAQPTISSFTPLTAVPGASVTITGTGFDATTTNNIVFFGAVKATVTAASTTSLTATVPVGATYASVSVTVAGKTAFSNLKFDPKTSATTTIAFPSTSTIATSDYPAQISAADLDGDGKPDLIVSNGSLYTISVYRNTTATAGGAVSVDAPIDFTAGNSPQYFSIGDLDGDGKPDIVNANYYGSSISILRNTSTTGTINFATATTYPAGTDVISLAMGDIDNDGLPDVAVVSNGGHTITLFQNASTPGNIAFTNKGTVATGTSPNFIVFGDFDGDGKQDIVTTATTGSREALVFRNTSSGSSFSFATALDISVNNSNHPYIPVTGDIDGDGKLDLVLANGAGNAVSVFHNTSSIGNISFTNSSFSGGDLQYFPAISDLNGDGIPDIATANMNDNTLTIGQNTSTSGNVSFISSTINMPAGDFPYSLAAADLNADGSPELIVGSDNNLLYTFTTANTPLPVTLLNFTGQYKNPNALLSWQTATESNSDYFNLERSTDQINYTSVAKIAAAGNSTSLLNYAYTDNLQSVTANTVYYRLKETDLDGKASYSKNIVKIDKTTSIGAFSIYPNPAADQARITGSSTVRRIKFVSASGATCLTQELNTLNPTINIATLAHGLYFVVVTATDNTEQTLQLLKN